MDYFNTIKNAVEFLERHLTEPFDNNELLKQVSYSSSQFHDIFKTITDLTVQQYLKKRRLSEAALELKNQNKRIIDTALKYQFSSPELFSRAFKEEFSITPKDYKKDNTHLPLTKKFNIDNYFDTKDSLDNFDMKEFKKYKYDMEQTFTQLLKGGFLNNYNFDYMNYTGEVEINRENTTKFLKSLPVLPLPSYIYNSDLVKNKENRFELLVLLSLIMKAHGDSKAYQLLIIHGKVKASLEELDYNISILESFYDIDNPIYDETNMYYYTVKKDLLEMFNTISI